MNGKLYHRGSDSVDDKIFEIKDSEVNVEEIMKEIRKDIKERNIQEVEFPELSSLAIENGLEGKCDFNSDIDYMNVGWNIEVEKEISSHRKIFGRIVVFIKKIIRKCLRWYVNPPFDNQREFNASVTRVCNYFKNHMQEVTESQNKKINECLSIMNEKDNKISELENKLNHIEEFIKKGNIIENQDVENTLEDKQDLTLKKNEAMTDLEERLLRVEENVRKLNQETEANQDYNLFMRKRLRRIEKGFGDENKSDNYINDNESSKVINKSNSYSDIDYFSFEQLYRGSRQEIKDRQKIYLKYFKGKQNVLDIGCGRGEMLELLKENGIENSKGIDINNDMVEYCKSKGLNVERADALGYLQNATDNLLDGIIISQVIEHLASDDIIKLIQLSYEKLNKDGILILETINPQCLSVFANSFYLDLSHNKPVHPFTARFMMKSEGFKNIEILYLSKILEEIPNIKSSTIENIDEINDAIGRLNNLLYGYQDYAIIGTK